MVSKVLFSSNCDNWSTPDTLFQDLDQEFNFNLDVCADITNHKCVNYFDIKSNGLSKSWRGYRVFCNPPYSNIKEWVKKCYFENKYHDVFICLLIPSRTDTSYFHDYIYHNAELRFIRGRLHFNNSKSSAPFPSMLCIFYNKGE